MSFGRGGEVTHDSEYDTPEVLSTLLWLPVRIYVNWFTCIGAKIHRTTARSSWAVKNFFLFLDTLLRLHCQQHVLLERMFEKFDKFFAPSGSFFSWLSMWSRISKKNLSRVIAQAISWWVLSMVPPSHTRQLFQKDGFVNLLKMVWCSQWT